MADSILTETIGQVRRITLNRPDKLNAWNTQMRDMLNEALDEAEADPGIRAIVLTGAGDRAFGAGQDLSESKTFDADRAETWMGEWKALYNRFRLGSKPIIAALNGLAAGSAFQVALLCDLRVAHPGVKMGQPEINSGIPTVTGNWIMREHLGLARTIDLTLTGRMIEAEEAFSFGLISRLVPADEVQATALELAELLAAKPPVAMRLDRQRIAEVTQAGFDDAMNSGVRVQVEAYGTGEPQAMMEAFFEARRKR
ncbi:enoyl-CoA hydratase/isomerase family protein [Afifella marina]|uniref:Enoyl-CoA hydratase/carnithine racemase n=2 Tax=Hyphomicrobiales TaxID=356 RepID=A0A1G5ME26_AFIMA|nr:enoyl-CoA hydratase/isomerase family protein [Afifella marina]MBK1622603.1 enoyl-CoA hydratase/isomerase family protein [Afifella marina DSM 2698]MBK1625598.1 enoyl-CoA hydratase/isomerase family protein [Afifella marina]MBK5917421.1 enoyl-CoA hydratase [Afifella marina]RAI23371.1 enoyl-CoA hydratase [Afifella marina DSM 2698]SCZ23114.1 Enoyl-CoA hydratase/carnithine racemase [Afifella marina DSM 2698]